MHFRGELYRALNPIYAREPLSGQGAELYGGRFNRKGTSALYTSLSIVTALREANQVGSLQPTMLVSYDADIERVFDSRDDDALRAEGMDAAALTDATWRDQMKARGKQKHKLLREGSPQRAIMVCWSEASRQARPVTTSTLSYGNGAMQRLAV